MIRIRHDKLWRNWVKLAIELYINPFLGRFRPLPPSTLASCHLSICPPPTLKTSFIYKITAKMFEIKSNQGKRMTDLSPLHLTHFFIYLGEPLGVPEHEQATPKTTPFTIQFPNRPAIPITTTSYSPTPKITLQTIHQLSTYHTWSTSS